MEPRRCDVLVIGGGIIGSLILRELSRYALDLLLVEAANDLSTGATACNGGVVHSGYDPEPEKLKARLNVRGNALYPSLAEELGVRFLHCGSMIVVFEESDLSMLDEYFRRGRTNGVPDLELITDRDRILRMEPHLNPEVRAALWAPSAGAVNPMEVTLAAVENAVHNGAEVWLASPVTKLQLQSDGNLIAQTLRGPVLARRVVNAAGLYADDVAALAGEPEFRIRPRKGGQYITDKRVGHLVRSFVYMAPSKLSKGRSAGPTTEGNLILGTSSVYVEDRGDRATTVEGETFVMEGVRRLLPEFPSDCIIRRCAGLRPTIEGEDFWIAPSVHHPSLIHAAGIQSPGVAAAPAIAEEVTRLLGETGLPLKANPRFDPGRLRPPHFAELSDKERDVLIRDDPSFGRIVCRCEQVSEAEVRETLRGPLAVPTLDAVKRRCRAGMGRCQGAFCRPRVARIITETCGLPLEEVTLRGGRSQVFHRRGEHETPQG